MSESNLTNEQLAQMVLAPGSWSDEIKQQIAARLRASTQAEAPQATKDAARYRSVLEEIAAMTFDEWTNGAIAGRMAQGALDAARKLQGEAP